MLDCDFCQRHIIMKPVYFTMKELLSSANIRTLSSIIYDAPGSYLSFACYQLIDNLSRYIFHLQLGENDKILFTCSCKISKVHCTSKVWLAVSKT